MYAVRLLMLWALWPSPVKARQPHQHWDDPPLAMPQAEWDALVDAEFAPFVGGRVYVQGDKLVPESVALAGGAR